MNQMPMSPELANQVYTLLVQTINSSESERENFVNYFTGKLGEVFHEYRITGVLNPGAKFKYFGPSNMYVDFYREHSTKTKETLLEEINSKLKSLV